MKRITVTLLTFAGIIFFASCNSGKNVKQILSKTGTRADIINKIAGNIIMSDEMIEALMNNKNGKQAIMDNNSFILELAKNDPGKIYHLLKENNVTPEIIHTAIHHGMPSIMMIN